MVSMHQEQHYLYHNIIDLAQHALESSSFNGIESDFDLLETMR